MTSTTTNAWDARNMVDTVTKVTNAGTPGPGTTPGTAAACWRP